jgi:aminopeptidase
VIDPDRFAALLCDWCLEVGERQQVLVVSTTLARPLVRSLHRELLERGAWPLLRLSFSELAPDFYAHARDWQLDAFPPLELVDVEAGDAYLRVDAPADTQALAGIEPARLFRAMRAREPIAQTRLTKRWCGTLWPTPALARQAAMEPDAYSEFINRALFLDRPDPLPAWSELSRRQGELVERLADAREIRIEADGTDLRLSVGGRTWINSDGRRNMPSGEVFTGPVEDSAEGTIRFTIPSYRQGAEVRDAELTFSQGRVTGARAADGEAVLVSALETDVGARFLGELGVGTNPGIDRATGSTLLDEKIAGTVHLALGRSYPETGGRNTSALHWDLICDLRSGGRLTADGEQVEIPGA